VCTATPQLSSSSRASVPRRRHGENPTEIGHLTVHVVLSATALCINPGGHHQKAVNKESVSAEGDFPVQNGKADFTLSVSAVFQPACSPPMEVRFTDVTVTDT
jgi:hypothetical protein